MRSETLCNTLLTMSLIEIYRGVLGKMSKTTPNENGVRTIELSAEEVQIIHVLEKEGTISLNQIIAPNQQYEFDGPHDPELGYFVEYEELNSEDDVQDQDPATYTVKTRLDALQDYTLKAAEFLGADADNRAERLVRVGGFVSYGSKLITYNVKPLTNLSAKETKILAEFLHYVNDITPLSELCSAASIDYAQPNIEDTFSKLITPLNNKLEALLGYRPISSREGRHEWVLTL